MGSIMSEKFYIGPEGIIRHLKHIEGQPELVLDFCYLPELSEIKWKDLGHEHAAKVALFVDNHISDNHST